jgi:ABC-type transport system involved in multi-copper enzyme maturation permease subunit
MFKEAVMKKLSAAVLLGLWLLISLGCSSAPSGTVAIKDLQKNMAQQVGQNVVVVGDADTRTTLSSFKMIKVYKGTDSIYVSLPEGTEAPPQGVAIRVTGVVSQKEFPGLPGKTYYIESTNVSLE